MCVCVCVRACVCVCVCVREVIELMDTISCVWIEIPGELPVNRYFKLLKYHINYEHGGGRLCVNCLFARLSV